MASAYYENLLRKSGTFRDRLAASNTRLNSGRPGTALANPTPYGRLGRGTSFGGGYGGGSGGGGFGGGYPQIPMPRLSPVTTPTLTNPTLPTYTAPERDPGRVKALQRKAFAPGLSALRGGVQSGITSTRSVRNPVARKFALRGLMSGFSEGIGRIKPGADASGLNQYEREFGSQVEEARSRHATATQQAIGTASTANRNAMMQYQQQIADRNTTYQMLAQMFAAQPLRRQAQSTYGSNTGFQQRPRGTPVGLNRQPATSPYA